MMVKCCIHLVIVVATRYWELSAALQQACVPIVACDLRLPPCLCDHLYLLSVSVYVRKSVGVWRLAEAS